MLTISYCPKCSQNIKAYGDFAYAVFTEISELYLNSGHIHLSSEDAESIDLTEFDDEFEDYRIYYQKYSEIIKYLEFKGFVVTTESSKNSIAIKPLGFHCYEENFEKFCHYCMDCKHN